MNKEVFEALVAAYRQRLYFYALQMLHNREDAEEVVQDVFLRVYRARDKRTVRLPDNARLTAWLRKITVNLVRNRLRKKQPAQIRIDGLSDSHALRIALEDRGRPDVVIDQYATFGLVERAVRHLPSYLVEAARLRFIDGLTHPEIAKRCSQPVGTVKARIFRAKRLLRDALEPAIGTPALAFGRA